MEQEIDYGRFRRLLESLEGGEVMIRIRSSGEGWSDYAQVLLLSENAMILQQGGQRRIVTNLHDIEEFEVDRTHLDFGPHVRYTVQKG